jgi:hypothetical protein
MDPDVLVVERMQSLVKQWEEAADPRMFFLRCYMLTTLNIIAAVRTGQFMDCDWVNRLMRRFTEYYFVALEAYEQDPGAAPRVWRLAHDAAANPNVLPIQKLLLGMSAHINYDLVLSLNDLLAADWAGLSDGEREERYEDHCQINQVIRGTIDAVQDQVLDPAMPIMGLVDRLLGRLDESMMARTIATWREVTWRHAVQLFEVADPEERARLIGDVEARALRHAAAINLQDWRAVLDEVL